MSLQLSVDSFSLVPMPFQVVQQHEGVHCLALQPIHD